MDLRCSAKDLIKNHLSMSLYNHAAIWDNDSTKWPRSMFCNGYILKNNEKMSKQTGNFMTLADGVDIYGSDACRIALADAGDSLDDANFVDSVANNSVLKIYVFEQWLANREKNVAGESFANVDWTNYGADFDSVDKIFDNELNKVITEGKTQFDEIKFKLALKTCWFELQNLKDEYTLMKGGKWNPSFYLKFVQVQLQTMASIIPHVTDYSWRNHFVPLYNQTKNHGEVSTSVVSSGWPVTSKDYDRVLSRQY